MHPGYLKGDNDAPASFLLSCAQPHPRFMVGRVGESKGSPGPFSR
nr:MAG TPA: Ash protein family protein [Bacteriophage sp.]